MTHQPSESDKEYFDFLDGLRDSGITNMFGAAPFLAEYSGLTRSEAREILSRWMDSAVEEEK